MVLFVKVLSLFIIKVTSGPDGDVVIPLPPSRAVEGFEGGLGQQPHVEGGPGVWLGGWGCGVCGRGGRQRCGGLWGAVLSLSAVGLCRGSGDGLCGLDLGRLLLGVLELSTDVGVMEATLLDKGV